MYISGTCISVERRAAVAAVIVQAVSSSSRMLDRAVSAAALGGSAPPQTPQRPATTTGREGQGRFATSIAARHSCWTVTESEAIRKIDSKGFSQPALFSLTGPPVRRLSTSAGDIIKSLDWKEAEPPFAEDILESLPTLTIPQPKVRPSTAPVLAKKNLAARSECTRLSVSSLLYGELLFELPRRPPPPVEGAESLEPELISGGLRVGDMKRMIYERVLLSPAFRINLLHFGIPLPDSMHIRQLPISDGARLDMTLTRVSPTLLATRGLGRVRVNCPALRTRTLPVDESSTVADLKRLFIAALQRAEHVWFTKGRRLHAQRHHACHLVAKWHHLRLSPCLS